MARHKTNIVTVPLGNGQTMALTEEGRSALERGYLVAPSRRPWLHNEFYEACRRARRPYVIVRTRTKYADFVADLSTSRPPTWDGLWFHYTADEEDEQHDMMREMAARVGPPPVYGWGGDYQFAHRFLPDDAERLAQWVVARFAAALAGQPR